MNGRNRELAFMRAIAWATATAFAIAAPIAAHAEVPPAGATLPIASAAEARAVLARLAGQRVRFTGDQLQIDDIAGEGRPWVGIVERRAGRLWLAGHGFAFELRGPLARPRIAGPGYRVWVTGAAVGTTLTVRRLGVLQPAPPRA